MTSWRDSASPQAQDDLDDLLNAALPFAQQMLGEHGEFYPCAVILDQHEDQRMVAGDPDGTDQPLTTDVLATLVGGIRADRDDLSAVALVSDVRANDSDAIRVELEHSEGPSMAVLLPYREKRMRRGVEFGALQAMAANPQIWRDGTPL